MSEPTDAERLDWLERNLLHLGHHRATNTVTMEGLAVHGQPVNEARGGEAGPSHFRVHHRTVREALDAAMQPPSPTTPTNPNAIPT